MNLFLHTQHYLSRGSRMACTPLLAALMLSATSYAANRETSLVTVKNFNKEAARINITGTVKDSKGEPLPGVSVKIKGTTTATSTDVNGVFRLNLPTGNETLVFSFLGFKTKEVAAKGQATISIRLDEDSQSLDEVVVVGYGTQRKANLTAAIETIKASEIEDLPVSNLGAAIAGRVLGVGTGGGTARPGSAASLTVRRPVTFFGKDGGTTEPLIVVDDVIQINSEGKPDATLFNSLDPSEVESISFLKDAAAAIYGSRAANGVVLVTTKRGKAGPPRISYSGSYAINDEAYRTKVLSAYEYGQYFNIMNGPNGSQKFDDTDPWKFTFNNDELEYFKGLNHNSLEEAWSSAYNMRHTLSVNGGAERATYFANVSYFKQNGNLSSVDFNRWNFRAGTDVNLMSNLKAGLQLSGNNSNTVSTFNKIGQENIDNDYRNLLLAPPYMPSYINGMAVKMPGTDNHSRYHFWEIERLNNLATNDNTLLTVNVYAEYAVPFVKGLKARASYARNMGNLMGTQVGSRYQVYEFRGAGNNRYILDNNATVVGQAINADNGNKLAYSSTKRLSTQFNFLTNYNRQFGDHSVSGLFAIERAEASSQKHDVEKSDPAQTTNGQLRTAFGEFNGDSDADETGALSYIGRANWSYKNKYLAEFLFRSDASTKFAPENYWGKFYSLATGWVISEEDFFDIPAVDFLKLRYSIGKSGNDQVKPWLWRQRYTFQQGKGAVFGGDTNPTLGIKMEASPNRDATWSDELKNNVGIDARFLNSRLSTTVEGYYNKATNVLIDRTGIVPITVGGSVASQNYGEMKIYGLEVALGWNDRIGRDFRYGIDTRFTWGDNKVIKMNFNDQEIMYPWNKQPGESDDNGVWGYDYLGMFRTQEEVDAYVNQYNITEVFGTEAEDLRPGTLYYRDVRGQLQPDGTFAGPDGIIDENDQVQLAKKRSNLYNFGITLKAGYKGLSVDAVIAGSFGGWSEMDGRSKFNDEISRVYRSLPAYWGNIYDPTINPSGTMPNPYFSAINLTPTSKFWEVNSFRMRMVNFNVNYTLPKKFVDALRISNARVYFTGVNPFNFYNPYSYRSTEVSYDVYPALKTYSFGVNLTL